MANELAEIHPTPPAVQRNATLVPRSLPEAIEFSRLIAESDFVPKEYRSRPANILVAIQWGLELGLGPLQALQSIAVVNGRPAIFGDGLLALVRASPVCESVQEHLEGEGEQMVAICRVKRKHEPAQERRFSVADAKRAGLWGKDIWLKYPQRMLQMRARAWALRDAFADVLRGLWLVEEAQDAQEAIPAPTPENAPTGLSAPLTPLPADRISERDKRALEAEIGKAAQAAGLDAAVLRERAKQGLREHWQIEHFADLTPRQYGSVLKGIPTLVNRLLDEQLAAEDETERADDAPV